MIAWYDNIPLVSYAALGGRCRHCHERISVRYPIVELATGLAFAVCVAALGLSLPALKYSIFSAILITLIASDLEERILPDEFTAGRWWDWCWRPCVSRPRIHFAAVAV
jgi:leader peptidase (prepilin peptidase)/N-methyltransferase